MKFVDIPNHHAVLLVTNERQKISNEIFKELTHLSPVHTFFDQTVLDIESARKIIYWANTPYNEEKIALVSFHTVGLEAQNALLKILEEPRNGVRFILVTSNKASLISTILSRVLCISDNADNESVLMAETFLKTAFGQRMKLPYVVEILSRTDEEDRKDREGVRSFILSLVTVLKEIKAEPHYIEEAIECASYAADPSASGKSLLEYLSLLLPQMKP